MTKLDPYEKEVLEAYESGQLKPLATKAELARMRAAARATAIQDRRVNIRLSSGDLHDLQAKALEEGMPYQTLIASVLHKYVMGQFAERPRGFAGPTSDAARRGAGAQSPAKSDA